MSSAASAKMQESPGIPVFFHHSPPVLSKWYDRFLMKKKALQIVKNAKIHLIHCRSYIAGEVGLFIKKKKNVPFLFDMRGLWADEKVDCGQWDQSKWIFRKIYQHYKSLEKELVLQSAHIISLTHKGKEELNKLYGNSFNSARNPITDKITVIPTCADFELFDNNKITEEEKLFLKQKTGIADDRIVISYSGSLGGWYMLDKMLLFFKAFKEIYPSAIFLCLTKDKHIIAKAIDDKLIDPADLIIHFAQKKELPLVLSLSDFSVFFIKASYSKLASSPTKHAELMGLGIPVFCNDIGDTGKLLRENNVGTLIDPEQENSFEQAIRDNAKKIYSKEEIRATGLKYFDVKEGIKKYLTIYKGILGD